MKRFLGLKSYFRRFIQNYAGIAKQISDLLRINVTFKKGAGKVLAFEQLKVSFVGATVLRL